jgi:TatD DNase family protein
MKLIDTHTHIYLTEFDNDRDEVIGRAVADGIIKLLMPNIDEQSVGNMLTMTKRYPDICLPMIGLHPTSVKQDWLTQLDALERIASENKFIAVGEIGIDLYWDKTFIREQIIAFRRQLIYAADSGLPVVIHSRDSIKEVFSVLDEFKERDLKGVFHAFSGDLQDARRAVEMKMKLGIGGVVTFKNSGLDKIVKEIGPEHIILETDSPYLTPSPHRGKRNEC